jgi:hypothetical protein
MPIANKNLSPARLTSFYRRSERYFKNHPGINFYLDKRAVNDEKNN